MINTPKMILFLCILFLQCGISMESNTISDNTGQQGNTLQQNNTVAMNVESDSLVLNKTNNAFGTQQDCAQGILKVFKWAFFHPGALTCSSLGATVYIYQNQWPLGVYANLQFATFMIRYICPNFALSKRLNDLAYFCHYSVPDGYIPPANLQDEINVPLVQADVNPNNQPASSNINQQGAQNQIAPQNNQVVTTQDDKCGRNCKIFSGWVLMSVWSWIITAILLICFTYDDAPVLGVLITVQALIYFIRKKFPNFACVNKLNLWARDVNADWEPIRLPQRQIGQQQQQQNQQSISIPMANNVIPANLNINLNN